MQTAQKTKDTSPISIGVFTPITGDAAGLGEFLKNVSDIAVDKINAEGGINGRKISLIYEDDACMPAKSVSAVQKLISIDNVKVILGSTCSGGVASAIPVAAQNGVFIFSGAATSPTLSGISPLFARTVPSDASQGSVLADYAISKNWKKIAIIQETADYPVPITNAFANVYTPEKGSIEVEGYSAGATDFRTILAKIKASNPDAVLFIPGSPAAADRLVSDFEKLKWNVPLMGSDIFSGNSEVVTKHKAALEDMAVAEQRQGPETSEYIAFKDEYKKRFGKDLIYESYAQAQYDLMFILRDGLKKYGDDPANIAAYVRTIKDYPGFSGGITIGSNGDRIGGHVIKVIKNGKATGI
jgi:branched-chain amino acid transport system substrate-binding protein